jgi:tetratricopeptide (TPR) repeat protein
VLATPSSVLRALESLSEGTGRVLVLSGPPESGKSASLLHLRDELERRQVEVISLQGTYRNRNIPFSGVSGLRDPSEALSGGRGPFGPEFSLRSPPLAYVPGPLTRNSRGRVARDPLLGGGPRPPGRPRAALTVDAADIYDEWTDQFRAHPDRARSILIDDGTFLDADSREVILSLAERSPLRPILIAVVLDISVPAFSAWEERLSGREHVDWIRFDAARLDAREMDRLRERFEELPESTRRILGYAAFMGGTVTETRFSAATRLPWSALSPTLSPAVEAGLVRIDGRRVQIPRQEWTRGIQELTPADVQEVLHREIAESLAGQEAEPDLERRVDLAEHWYAGRPGSEAIRHLVEAASLTERLGAFDRAEDLLGKAIRCLPTLPEIDRNSTESDLRLAHARLLLLTGRIQEAEGELHAGITMGLRPDRDPQGLEGAVESLLTVLMVVGPRPSLITQLAELVDRCHDRESIGAEVLIMNALAELELQRGRPEVAREHAARALRRAHTIRSPALVGLSMVGEAAVRAEGAREERMEGLRLLREADPVLGSSQSASFRERFEQIEVRLLRATGQPERALRVIEQGISSAVRSRSLVAELDLQVARAELLLEAGEDDAAIDAAVVRGRDLEDRLHLVPPSPDLLRLRLIEGRRSVAAGHPHQAADLWTSIVDLPIPLAPPRLRAESLLRLVVLETGRKDWPAVERYLAWLSGPEMRAGLTPAWRAWLDQMQQRAEGTSDPGSGRGSPASP